jgi:hypothetical protein
VFGVRAWSLVRAENVPSCEPSSTKTASQGSSAGLERGFELS